MCRAWTKPLLVEDLAAALASLVPAPRYAFLRDACGGDLARMDALLRVMSTQAAADLDALQKAIDRGDAATVVVLSRRLQAIADQLESPQAAAPLAALASEPQGAWHALHEDARTALRTAMASCSPSGDGCRGPRGWSPVHASTAVATTSAAAGAVGKGRIKHPP